jgi:hypothetical protein
MKPIITPLLFLFTIIFFSCKESPETTFSKEGIFFTCPQGWSVTDEDSLDGLGYNISVEKDGFNSSALFTILRIDGFVVLDDWLNNYRDELNDNIIYRNANLRFGAIRSAEFNGVECKKIDFTASILGLKHSGSICAFHTQSSSMSILKQEADEDHGQNKDGFQLIEDSFKTTK